MVGSVFGFALPVAAVGLQPAVEAIGAACLADVASVEYQPVVGACYQFLRNVAHEGALGLERCAASGGQTDALADAEHVGVDRHSGFVEHYGKYHVSRLASYAGYGEQGVDVGRDFAAEVLDERACHSDQAARLVVGV